MKKVLIITTHFPPDRHVGAHRPAKFAKFLPQFGWQSVILTIPTNETRDGMDLSLLDDLPKYLKVYRVPGWMISDNTTKATSSGKIKLVSRFRSIIGAFFLPHYNVNWIVNGYKEGIKIIRNEKIDLIYSTVPDLEAYIIAFLLSISARKKFVCDFRDPTRWMLHRYFTLEEIIMLFFLKFVLWRANAVVSISNVLRQRLIEVGWSLNRKKYVTIYNGFDKEDFNYVQRSFNKKAFIITYVGSWGGQRNPKFFLDAVEDLLIKNKGLQGKIKIIFVGWVKRDKRLEQWLKERLNKGILSTTVEVKGYLPYNQALNEMQKANVLLACNSEREVRKGCLESKFFEYLYSGKPILVLGAKACDLDFLLNDLRAGILVPPTETKEISKAIYSLYKDYCNGFQKGVDYNDIKKFEREQITKKLADLFNAIMNGQKNLIKYGH